jgi:hypothetical protein
VDARVLLRAFAFAVAGICADKDDALVRARHGSGQQPESAALPWQLRVCVPPPPGRGRCLVLDDGHVFGWERCTAEVVAKGPVMTGRGRHAFRVAIVQAPGGTGWVYIGVVRERDPTGAQRASYSWASAHGLSTDRGCYFRGGALEHTAATTVLSEAAAGDCIDVCLDTTAGALTFLNTRTGRTFSDKTFRVDAASGDGWAPHLSVCGTGQVRFQRLP